MIKESRYSYSDTVSKLSKAIADAGNTIFATIDQAAAASGVGLVLRPTSLIIEQVKVAFVPMREIAARYGIAGMDTQIAGMDRGLDNLANLIT